jgi:hypothetical protein
MKLNIELGEKGPETVAMSDSPKGRVYYPELHITEDEPLDLPKEGTMVIRYKKVATSERDGKYSCTVEVHELISATGDEPEAPSKRDKSGEEALDDLAEKKAKERGY